MSTSTLGHARGIIGRGGAVAGGLLLAVIVASPASAYEVADGDTLSEIALRHHVPTTTLAAANGIANPDRIVSGTVLEIPDSQGGTATSGHVVQPGETLSDIAAQHGIGVIALAGANGITDPDRIISGRTLSLQAGGVEQPAVISPEAEPADRDTVRQLISSAAAEYGWNPAIPLGLAMVESGWNNTVVSPAGAKGLFQVLPATGEWAGTYLLNRPVDLNDPADNVAAGMAYLDYLYDRFEGNAEHALAAYFEGPGRTERAGGPSTPGAERYVATVMAVADRYR
ncbi:MAG TPA: LysM peptidoglycan-binding domain-containing protein [Euzebya sp.]|nr:LysM peptidoglycan-binding domain-containing protein [Euzebya sp.]